MLNFRHYIIAGLLILGTMLLFAEPNETLSNGLWTFVLVVTKTLAFSIYYGAEKLAQHWIRKGQMQSFNELFKED